MMVIISTSYCNWQLDYEPEFSTRLTEKSRKRNYRPWKTRLSSRIVLEDTKGLQNKTYNFVCFKPNIKINF